jgi:Protein of unknown function (DUF2867)
VEPRVRRVEVPRTFAVTGSSGHPSRESYASAFALPLDRSVGRPRSAEQWARAVFEDAPRLLRFSILFGWRFFLGLRLQPLDGADQVLGWRLEARDAGPESVALAADSKLLRAENIVATDGSVVLWVTIVHFDGRMGSLLWRVASPVHHMTIPYLLARAGREQSPGAAPMGPMANGN